MDREIENRIQKANNVRYQLAPLLKHPDNLMETKSKIISSIFVPTLTYQCHIWTMTKSLERKSTSREMRCLRKAANKTRRDMNPNTKNQKNGRKKEHSPSYSTAEDQMVWTSHKTAIHHPMCIQHKIQRLKARERPRKTWINGVKETLSLYNIPPAQAFRRAADISFFPRRPKWYKR